MKTQNLLVLAGLVIGLAACGGGDEAPAKKKSRRYNPDNSYDVYPDNNNPSKGFRDVEAELVRSLQSTYGDISLPQSAVIGGTSLKAKTKYSWKKMVDIVSKEAERCLQVGYCQTYGYTHQYGSILSRVDLYQLREYLQFERVLSYRAVRYQRYSGYTSYNLAHTVDQILSMFGSSSSGLYQHYGMNYGYQVYTPWYGGQYSPWYGQNNLYLGVGYNSGSGLSIGGHFNWNNY